MSTDYCSHNPPRGVHDCCPQKAPRGVHVYSAKFLCGLFDAERISDRGELEGPVKPGRYATAINVHNPHPHKAIRFRKKGSAFVRREGPRACGEI
jgi:hypothetical protein